MATLKISAPSVSLTAPQVLALAAAAGRGDGAVTLPTRIKGRAAQNFVDALTGKGLVREVRAKPDMPMCRRDAETGRAYALVITKLGRSSIPAPQQETHASAAEPMTAALEKPRMLDAPTSGPTEPTQNGSGTNAAAGEGAPSAETNGAGGSTAPRSGSKLAEVIALLLRERGASIEELMASTGWLPHTTRAALTGLRKRGYAVLRKHAEDKGSVYRIEPVSSAKAA